MINGLGLQNKCLAMLAKRDNSVTRNNSSFACSIFAYIFVSEKATHFCSISMPPCFTFRLSAFKAFIFLSLRRHGIYGEKEIH